MFSLDESFMSQLDHRAYSHIARYFQALDEPMRLKPQKPLTPDQAKIQGMKNQVKNTQKLIKAEKARQKIKAGQTQLANNLNNL